MLLLPFVRCEVGTLFLYC